MTDWARRERKLALFSWISAGAIATVALATLIFADTGTFFLASLIAMALGLVLSPIDELRADMRKWAKEDEAYE